MYFILKLLNRRRPWMALVMIVAAFLIFKRFKRISWLIYLSNERQTLWFWYLVIRNHNRNILYCLGCATNPHDDWTKIGTKQIFPSSSAFILAAISVASFGYYFDCLVYHQNRSSDCAQEERRVKRKMIHLNTSTNKNKATIANQNKMQITIVSFPCLSL